MVINLREVYQLKVQLKGIRPPVWRCFKVWVEFDSDLTIKSGCKLIRLVELAERLRMNAYARYTPFH